jgi:spore coat protein H
MAGLTIATDKPTEVHAIVDNVVVPPRSYLVLAQAGLEISSLPASVPVYTYPGSFKLSNGDGELAILDGNRVIDIVSYRENGWWPIRSGESMTLHPQATSVYFNDDALNWCLGWTPLEGSPEILATPGAPNDACPMWDINSPFVDQESAYEPSTFEPITFHITITLDDLDSMNRNPFSDVVYPIHFSSDGPVVAAVSPENNGNIRPRGGRGTRSAAMLSYRVRLDEPFWGHRTLQLNKHLGDPTRLRNSLAFRVFQGIDDMVSLRTQFVHLFLNGEDQGLYTMIESPSRPFLRQHRLDERGGLFKIGLPSGTSSFFYYEGSDRASRIESIQLTAQLETGFNHDGLIEMVDAVYSDEDLDTIIERYFNRENLLTYFSLLYLVQNRDTRVQNYMVYSTPREPQRIYFIPWDWDVAFRVRDGSTVFGGRWREGLGNWSGMGIMDRMVQDPEMVDALVFRMLELVQTSLSPERVNGLADQLAANVEPFTRRAPEHLELSPSALAATVEEVKTVIPESARLFIETIEWPLPPRADAVLYSEIDNSVRFVWLPSYDIQEDELSYEIVLFNDRIWDESHIIWRSDRTTRNSMTITSEDVPDEVPAGTYYWMVYVWDDENHYNTSQVGSLGEIATIVDLP